MNFKFNNKSINKKYVYMAAILLLFAAVITSVALFPRKEADVSFKEYTNNIFTDYATRDAISLNYLLKDPSAYEISNVPYTLGVVSTEEFANEREYAADCIKTLHTYNYDSLDEREKVIYDSLMLVFKQMISGSDYDLYHEVLNPSTGIQCQLPILLAEYHFYTKNDIDNYLKTLPMVYEYFDSICDFEHKKSKAGLFMSKTSAESIISQCEDYIANPDVNLLITVFDERIDAFNGLSDAEVVEYKLRNKKIVKDKIVKAYKKLIDTLDELKETGKNDGGLCNFKNGAAYYELLVQSTLGSTRTMDNMITVLENTILNDTKTLTELMTDNPDILEEYQKSDYGLKETDDILKRLKERAAKDFPDIGEVSLNVKDVPASLENYISPAMFLLTPIDDYKNNVIYINNSLKYINTPQFSNLAHEGWPGHLYQNAYYCEHNDYPVLSIIKNNGYIEGWATYAADLAYSYSDMNKEVANLNAVYNEMVLCLSARADIGINYEGWDSKRVLDYFSDHYCTIDEEAADSVCKLVISDPGNYVTYAFGSIEIKRIKQEQMKKLGDDFDLKEFHKQILDAGPVPFDVLISLFK